MSPGCRETLTLLATLMVGNIFSQVLVVILFAGATVDNIVTNETGQRPIGMASSLWLIFQLVSRTVPVLITASFFLLIPSLVSLLCNFKIPLLIFSICQAVLGTSLGDDFVFQF